jgi:AcrR family transcriptional regulator
MLPQTMPRAPRTRRRIDQRTRSARIEGRDGRVALLDAALEVFGERGYRDASVDEIAVRAGYSKGAIYFHFSGKDDLFHALLEERLDRALYAGLELLATGSPEHDMSLEASRRFAEIVRTQRGLLLLEQEYRSLALRDRRLRTRYAARQRRLRSAFAGALAARLEHLGAPPASDPEQLAGALMALMSGLTQELLIDPGSLSDGLLGEMFALVYAGHVASVHGVPAP